MPFSHHSHSGQFCSHAHGTLEQVVQTAISKGFKSYCLTEHIPRNRLEDLYPEEQGKSIAYLHETFGKFVDEAWRLKRLYQDQINILVGLETEFINENSIVSIKELLAKYDKKIQLIVGSVHHVNEIPIDFDITTFNRALDSCQTSKLKAETFEEKFTNLTDKYLDAQFTLLSSLKPEIIGHFDLFKLYHPNFSLDPQSRLWSKLSRNVRFAIGYGALFEINSAAFRKGWETAYPGQEILSLILELNGRLTLSDDSHGPLMVGLNYQRTFDYLKRMGLSKLWYLVETSDTNEDQGFQRGTVAKIWKGGW